MRRRPAQGIRSVDIKEPGAFGSASVVWPLVLVALLSLLCYVQTTSYGFVYDDDVQIVRNPRIRSFAGVGKAFEENFWAFRAPGSFSNYYRPLQTITFMIGFAVSGLHPSGYHWINLLLHMLSSMLVFVLAFQLFEKRWVAAAAGLLFASHPMHTESVAWIAGVTDVGCGLFYFAALAAFLRYRKEKSGSLLFLALSIFAFLLSLFYKEMALTLPFLIVLADLFFLERPGDQNLRARLVRWMPFIATLSFYAAIRIRALGVFSKSSITVPIGFLDRVATVFVFVGRYLRKLLFPFDANAYYVFTPFSKMSFSQLFPDLLVLIVVMASLWMLRHDRRLVYLGICCILTLAPVLQIGTAGQNMFTERYLYIPSFGFCILLPAVADRLLGAKGLGRVLLAGTLAVVVLFAALTIRRNPVWKDNLSLYSTTLAASPDATAFHNNLGAVHFKERRYSDAAKEFRAALGADGRVFLRAERERSASYLGLSSVANVEGRAADALDFAQKALAEMPNSDDAVQTLGMLMGKQGSYAESEKLLRRALEINPMNPAARVNLANLLFLRSDLRGAEQEFRRSIDLDPAGSGARVAYAALLIQSKRLAEARIQLQTALDNDPANERARQLVRGIESNPARER